MIDVADDQAACLQPGPPLVGEQLDLAALEKIFIDKPLTRYTLAGKGLYVGSRLPDIHAALTSAGLKSGDVFIDLGSGDGRVVCLAALLGARALGLEADSELHRLAIERAETVLGHYRGSHGRLEIDLRLGDFLAYSVAETDVIFYYAGGAG